MPHGRNAIFNVVIDQQDLATLFVYVLSYYETHIVEQQDSMNVRITVLKRLERAS